VFCPNRVATVEASEELVPNSYDRYQGSNIVVHRNNSSGLAPNTVDSAACSDLAPIEQLVVVVSL
jgi:hypothetical protein